MTELGRRMSVELSDWSAGALHAAGVSLVRPAGRRGASRAGGAVQRATLDNLVALGLLREDVQGRDTVYRRTPAGDAALTAWREARS